MIILIIELFYPVTATSPAKLPLHSITKLNLEFYYSLKI